tara:strand:- start:849 stop:995 length:147 start_codon:yes stop_codon:yes gene_type:complete
MKEEFKMDKKAMVGWWTGQKECNCNNPNCKRAGGQACVRRSKRVIKNE